VVLGVQVLQILQIKQEDRVKVVVVSVAMFRQQEQPIKVSLAVRQ
jgi:hypothetical protein